MIRVVVAIPYGLAFRNIVCCGVLAQLSEAGAELTVLLPATADDDRRMIAAELPPRTRVEPLCIGHVPSRYQFFKFLKQHYYGKRTALESFEIKKRFRRRDTPLQHLAMSAVERAADLLVPEGVLDRWLLHSPYPCEQDYIRQLQTWKTDVVVVTKPGYHPDELAILKAAKRLGVPTIAIDTTWDNMVSKRPPYVLPDAATMWNPEMAEQALQHYQMSSAHVRVTGGVQFDTFFRPSAIDRSAVLRALDLDSTKPLVVFALSNPAFTAGTPDFARGFVDRVSSGEIRGRPNVVIRTHPWDPGANDYTAGTMYDALRIERPYHLPSAGTIFECVATRQAVLHQGDLYRAADVIVNIAGTTSLDGIAVDRPVVNIAFDAIPVAHADLSVSRFSRYSHYLPILESGAVRLASSWEELCAHVNDALSNPGADAPARARARTRFLGKTDHHASGRVAEAIVAAARAPARVST